VASNGEEVLAQLGRDRFDLLLMDVQMPQMDGFEATRQIRRQEQAHGRHIPIIAMTAHALPEDRDRCLSAGMDEYVAKPIRTRALVTTIAAVLRQHGSEPACVATVERESHGDRRDEGEAIRRIAGIDWDLALEELDGNAQVLHIVVEAALDESPRLAASLRAAIDSGDATQLRLTAHTLKGALRYFGDSPAFDAAQHLERMGYEGNFDNAGEACDRLDDALAVAMNSMNEYLQSDATETTAQAQEANELACPPFAEERT
jgi:CheY-like chemotaxis protein/HPt (histidine-containing phosphotransfer) domain-containing protein